MSYPEEYEVWQPESSEDFDEWIKVQVGSKDQGGHWFQIHVCSYSVISTLRDKKYIFPISNWVSVDDFVGKLESFVNEYLPNDEDSEENMKQLSKVWFWEYARHN